MIDKDSLERAVVYADTAAEELYKIPESSFCEYRTSEYIRKAAKETGALIIDTGMETGVLAYIEAGKESPDTVALRADIDAVTGDKGARHLCGHNHHTASLLGAMKYIAEHRNELENNVLFIFQPAEENTSGAKKLIEKGLFSGRFNICRVFGIHNRPQESTGKIIVHEGSLMAGKSNFVLNIIGRSGHGGEPHNCIDPMLPAAQFIMAVNTIVGKNIEPSKEAVCAVCSIHAGTDENQAPDNVRLTGSIRYYDENIALRMKARIMEIAEGISAAFECGCSLEWVLDVPPVINSPEMTEYAYKAARETAGEENIQDTAPVMGSDDFAFYGEYAPSFYYWVGSGEPGRVNAGWHMEDFCVADNYQKTAVPLLINSAMMKITPEML